MDLASFSCGCPACLPEKLFIVPLRQVGGEILLLIQAYQESRGPEVVERDVGVIVVARGVDLRTGEKLAADLAVFHAQDDSVAASGWGVADPPDTSEAESTREHSAVAGLSSQTDSSSSFLSSARTGGTLGYHRDPNR